MDIILFKRFLENLLNIRVYSFDENDDMYSFFEKECCFDASLQPMYTANGLSYILSNLSDQTFYEITDQLKTSLLLFRFEGITFSLGPYVKASFSKEEMQEILAQKRLPASILLPLKMYYESFPQLSYAMVNGALSATMRTFIPNTPVYNYRQLTGFSEDIKRDTIINDTNKTYAQILQQYEMENFFLRKITDGDVNGVELAFENIASNFYLKSDPSERVLYSTNSNGFAVLRTLARKAAETGGAPVVKIDEITRNSIQRYNRARSANEIAATQKDMLIELTKAVSDAKNSAQYSPVIRSVLGYVTANYSNDLSLSSLAEHHHVSQEHLARLFKKEIGQTITEYITSLRIKKAAELLKSSALPISEIALYVGYNDSNYFVKRFKKIYGITPSAYRCLC